MASRLSFFRHDESGTIGTIVILCYISAHIGDLTFCDYWLPAVEEVGELYCGYVLYQILKRKGGHEEAALRYLRSAADSGYLDAKKELFRLRTQKVWLFARPLLLVHSLYLAAYGTIILLRNEDDPRLPRWLDGRAQDFAERGWAALRSPKG